MRTALVTFGVDASHGYERIHLHALRSLSELITAYTTSSVHITRDFNETGHLDGFTRQDTSDARQAISPQDEPEGPAPDT